MIAFISGGARSGKSAQAEALALRWHEAHGGSLYYLATGSATDAEMQARIERHRRARGPAWRTLEAPVDLLSALARVESNGVVLLDCLTLWASQLLYASDLDAAQGIGMIDTLLAQARARGIALVIVSNDINEGVLPDNAGVWRYLTLLQGVHHHVVEQADLVVQVVAGLPWVWKGDTTEVSP